MKKAQALIASAIVTGMVALAMLLIGINALTNTNSVPPANTQVSAVVSPATGGNDAQIAQLQDQVAQYQAQLDQANTELQQYQQVLSALQARGVIRITGDGQIQLGRRGGDGD